ncbi:MAG: M23 family metallopeptidase [Anaerolineales bacterium]|nr:M23 family metallopeptidase [Anaerolineales bacterium]
MSFARFGALLVPGWLQEWFRYRLWPYLGFQPRPMLLSALRGGVDTLVLLAMLGTAVVSGQIYMNGQYTLPADIQRTAVQWAPVAAAIARQADIPREVPLVIWFKENSMRAENPDNCTGIVGAYDLVRSGQLPCFTPGPINDFEVVEQLTIGALEFKKRCPDVTYMTHDPELIKRCYFAYNAGVGAASRLDANDSAYVMNDFDAAHANMTYSDIELGTVQVTALGAWPAHLAFASLSVSQLEHEDLPPAIPFLDTSTRVYDGVMGLLLSLQAAVYEIPLTADTPLGLDPGRILNADCLGEAHDGLGRNRPDRNPVTESPILTQDVHGCSYNLPGIDIASKNQSALLQAPISGYLTTYTDQWYNTTIRIENSEWIVWLLHPRSYLVEEGEVVRGQAVGVMGAIGYATGPHVHFSVYDKLNKTFVDPGQFLP